jgi:hypothetical protein
LEVDQGLPKVNHLKVAEQPRWAFLVSCFPPQQWQQQQQQQQQLWVRTKTGKRAHTHMCHHDNDGTTEQPRWRASLIDDTRQQQQQQQNLHIRMKTHTTTTTMAQRDDMSRSVIDKRQSKEQWGLERGLGSGLRVAGCREIYLYLLFCGKWTNEGNINGSKNSILY